MAPGLRSLPLFFIVTLAACAAPAMEDQSDSDSALTGTVTDGTVVKTVSDGLRLRKTPSQESSDNIIGLLPLGTSVRVLDGKPNAGFYKVEVTSPTIAKALPRPDGWVFGKYLEGKEPEPVIAPVVDDEGVERPMTTGTHDEEGDISYVSFTVSDCKSLTDDKGQPMRPYVDDVLLKNRPYGVIAIDTNAYSWNMAASIDELDQKSSFNPNGQKIPLRIVKTNPEQAPGGYTITICVGNTNSAIVIPAKVDKTTGQKTLTLRVFG